MLPSNLLAYKTDSLWNELGVQSSWLDNRLIFNAAVFDAAAAKARIDAQLDKDYPELDALYRDIHAHPELGFQELRTSALLAARMRKLGFEVTEHIGKTGIVAIYRNGPGPVVLVRTELDALPMEEKTGLPYASHAQQTVDGAKAS